MNGGDPGRWSAVAADWAELWGSFAEPVWQVVVDVSGIGPGSRVLDVGCGGGDLLAHLDRFGVATAGIDPAPAMVDLAQLRVPGGDIRLGTAQRLPWPDASFDLVTSINALQFADDTLDALTELARVTKPGGLVAISNWAEAARNDLDTIEDAVAHTVGDVPLPDGDLRHPGGLERLLVDGGLNTVAAGLVDTPWAASDDDVLLRAVLLGEDPDSYATKSPAVLENASGFRTRIGGYHLNNAFRYALGRTQR